MQNINGLMLAKSCKCVGNNLIRGSLVGSMPKKFN